LGVAKRLAEGKSLVKIAGRRFALHLANLDLVFCKEAAAAFLFRLQSKLPCIGRHGGRMRGRMRSGTFCAVACLCHKSARDHAWQGSQNLSVLFIRASTACKLAPGHSRKLAACQELRIQCCICRHAIFSIYQFNFQSTSIVSSNIAEHFFSSRKERRRLNREKLCVDCKLVLL
jgi:hypothetical protein